jgi:Rad3-related DNA helicase
MGPGILAVGAVAVLLLVSVLALCVVLARSRAASRRQLEAARAETAELRDRIDALDRRWQAGAPEPTGAAYVITDAGTTPEQPTVPDRLVLNASLAEPLLKVAAFGHGVRRALSAESRNRIRFEVRREVRASRRERRRNTKELLREARAARRAAGDAGQPDAA